ncbi:MAG TPA: cell wall-binding repeat-containing protein, partial [Nocardioides sp.]|nr:cell wall-binding repeat-containing protein [Nocardioides sp.]
MALALPGLVWMAWPSGATANFMASRIGGPDRYDTARQVAEKAFGTANTVILANGLNYPDALAGAYLAGTTNVPILLTNPDSLSAAASQALKELKTKNVTVLGGNLAVSDNVVSQLGAQASTSAAGGNLVASRLFGPTRYETAAAVAGSGGPIGTVDGQPTALVASGNNFPDALSAGPASFSAHLPILLTDKDTESPTTEAALQHLNIKNIILLGGTEAVSANVAASLASGGGGRTVTRIGGVDRTDTAAQFYEQVGLKKLAFSNKKIFLANGITFPAPDALAGSPLAGQAPTAILLASNADDLGQFTTAEIQNHASTLTSGTILGQTAAISPTGQSQFVSAAGGASNSNGPITLNNTTVAPGGTITGTVASPSNVAAILANGCGLNNQNVPFGTGGAFSVVIPTSQPGGVCSLTFHVTHNDGTSPDDPSFTINVTNPTVTFHAPTLVAVTAHHTPPQA